MIDFLLSAAGWLGEALLSIFDFLFFVAFLLALFYCLGCGFGLSIYSKKPAKSYSLFFFCTLASIVLFPLIILYCTMVIGLGYPVSDALSLVFNADKTTKFVFTAIALSVALPALLIGYWMNPGLDLPDIQKLADKKASELLEDWKEREQYEQKRKEVEIEQRSQQIEVQEKSLKNFETKLREMSQELVKQRKDLEHERKKAQAMIARAEAAIKQSESRVEELSNSNLQLKNQLQRLIPKSRQYPAVRKVVLRYLPEDKHESFIAWDKNRIKAIEKSLRDKRNRNKPWEKIKLPDWEDD